MIKKLLIAAAMASSTLVTVPTAAAAMTPEDCLLRAGCTIIDGAWSCPDPKIYLLCDIGGWDTPEP